MQPASDAFLATDSNQSMRYSLLDDIQEFIGLAWSALVMLVGLVSVILLLVTVQLDGDLDGDFLNRQWTGRFAPLVLTLFILAVYPRLRRQYMNAINAFRYLLVREETTFEQMVAEMAPLNRRHELMAAGIGVIMGWGINNPLMASPQWTQIYSMALNGL
ncbi:MAG TPA: hypothetical protein VJZ27_15770, partial [Aggregatilineales bacterium]|nr:hypothetical protein [Aggregatilineales bacterium]